MTQSTYSTSVTVIYPWWALYGKYQSGVQTTVSAGIAISLDNRIGFTRWFLVHWLRLLWQTDDRQTLTAWHKQPDIHITH